MIPENDLIEAMTTIKLSLHWNPRELSYNYCFLTVASFLSFKRQHILEWYFAIAGSINTLQKLVAWSCCPHSYFFGRLIKSMNLRLTSAQISGKKIFENFFIGSKEPPSNFRGLLGGHLNLWLHLLAGKPVNTLWSFKGQKKDATVK